MITVFGGWPTRSMRVQWLLEELGVPYELHQVDLRKRMEDSDLMAVNPVGFLPAMIDGDVRMVESVAIMEYLLSRYGPGGLAPAPDAPEYPAYLQFLHLGEAGLSALLNVVVASRFAAPEPDKDNWGARMACQMFQGRMKLVDARLANSPYLAGEQFTAADICVHYALELAGRLGQAETYSPAVVAYRDRLTEREGYKRALERSPPWPGR